MVTRRLLRVLALTTLVGVVGTTVAEAAPSSTGTAGAALTATPFDNPNVFCTKGPAPAGPRNSSSPGITPNSITITDMSIDAAVLRRLGSDQMDFNQAIAAFVDTMNGCGGINGRRIVLKKASYNPIATDMAGHLQALCLKATEDQKAFIVTGVGPPPVQRCLSVNHRTIFDGPVGVLSSEFAAAKGRIVSLYPAGDKQAAAFIADGVAQGIFKGHSVAVLGANTTATAVGEQQDQYVDGLEQKGVDVKAFEVLPCVATVCTQGIGSAVSRMKAKGVDFVVLSHYITVATLGSIFREFKAQGFKPAVWGPHTASLHDDSTLPALVRTAGSDGAAFAADNGWYLSNVWEVHNAWRTGQAKETPFARMCTSTLAKATGGRQYQYNEQDISNARWGATTKVCIQLRELFRAIDSLGNNVTTDRMVTALRNEKALDRRETTPLMRDKRWYIDRDVAPSSIMTAKFHFPCPLPGRVADKGCFLPVDRPARVRTIKY